MALGDDRHDTATVGVFDERLTPDAGGGLSGGVANTT